MAKARRLGKLVVDRVDLVDRGANPHAHVALFKREEAPKVGAEQGKEGNVPPEDTKVEKTDADGTVDESKKADESKKDPEGGSEPTLEQRVKDLEARLEVEKAARAEAEEKVAKAEESKLTPEQKIEKSLSSLPAEVAKAVQSEMASVTKRLEEAEAIAKAERDARLNAEYIAKARTLGPIAKAEEFGPVLKSLAEKAPEEYAKVEEALRAASEQVAKTNLFKEFGTELAGANTDAYSKLEAKAEELRKVETSLSREQAIAKATEMNPDLARQYQAEVRAGRGE